MKEEIKLNKKGNIIIIKIPLKRKRYCPYTNVYKDEMIIISALIDKSRNECGFVWNIDMSYKGKIDQYTDIFYKFNGSIEEFEKICKKLKINIIIN